MVRRQPVNDPAGQRRGDGKFQFPGLPFHEVMHQGRKGLGLGLQYCFLRKKALGLATKEESFFLYELAGSAHPKVLGEFKRAGSGRKRSCLNLPPLSSAFPWARPLIAWERSASILNAAQPGPAHDRAALVEGTSGVQGVLNLILKAGDWAECGAPDLSDGQIFRCPFTIK